MSQTPHRIAIYEDNNALRETLKLIIEFTPGYTCVGAFPHGNNIIQDLEETRPDVVLMDIDMPIMDGIEAVAEGKLRFSKTRYLMLTIFDEDEKIFNAIKAGANGYLLKDEPIDKIKEAIDSLMNGESAPLSPSIARKVLNLLTSTEQNFNKQEENTANEYNLTEREKEILTLLIEGLEYKEIAQELKLSPNTIRNNVTKIYSKLHVTSRMQAAKLFNKR